MTPCSEAPNPLSAPSKAATVAVGLAVALVLALALLAGSDEASADHEPANKVAVAGSTVKVAGPGEDVTLLDTTMRNAAAKSLALQVTLECSILTDLETVGDDLSRARSNLDVWVEIDGKRVPVADEDNGEVTFCNREYQRQTRGFDDEDATIDGHIATKQAHGFNWMDLQVGNGTHDIKVKGRLETDSTANANAEVTVGNRTLVVEPVQAAHDETKAN